MELLGGIYGTRIHLLEGVISTRVSADAFLWDHLLKISIEVSRGEQNPVAETIAKEAIEEFIYVI